MASSPGTLQSRTKSRAKRLGLKPSSQPYTRGQARKIKRQLRAAKSGGQPGPLNSGSPATSAPAPASDGGVAAPSAGKARVRRSALTFKGKTGINQVQSGPGSARKGREFQVAQDDDGTFVHVYKRGARKRLSKSVAKAYGYIK